MQAYLQKASGNWSFLTRCDRRLCNMATCVKQFDVLRKVYKKLRS